MILIGLGANLPGAHGGPVETLEAALAALERSGVVIEARSRWYETAPVPVSDQPWYVNGVARIRSDLGPGPLLALLHRAEAALGRIRSVVNAPRAVDLDLLDHHGRIERDWPVLPHPRLAERAFVLAPLDEVAPDWRHPVTGEGAAALLAALPPGQEIRLKTDG